MADDSAKNPPSGLTDYFATRLKSVGKSVRDLSKAFNNDDDASVTLTVDAKGKLVSAFNAGEVETTAPDIEPEEPEVKLVTLQHAGFEIPVYEMSDTKDIYVLNGKKHLNIKPGNQDVPPEYADAMRRIEEQLEAGHKLVPVPIKFGDWTGKELQIKAAEMDAHYQSMIAKASQEIKYTGAAMTTDKGITGAFATAKSQATQQVIPGLPVVSFAGPSPELA